MTDTAELIRVRGLVQGVGFRPTMWRLAHRHGLRGWVANDGRGVRMHICGPILAVEEFVLDLSAEAPPLARIDHIEREPALPLPFDAGFHIAGSEVTAIGTDVAPDAATCVDCIQEIFDSKARRFRYPFTNCTNCGPRLSIIQRVPYDRARTSMAQFSLCRDCEAEYQDPTNRRYHAEPIACPVCGPKLSLRRTDGAPIELEASALDAACTLLKQGQILAIQGLGGYQLACDATQPETVARLRNLKRRARRPFALMARDLAVIRLYTRLHPAEAALLMSPAAPIVLLARAIARSETAADQEVAAVVETVAPGLNVLGIMLPNTPLHHLLLERMPRPIVLTSGNLSDEPQAIEASDARQRLSAIVDYFLEHDRPIERRVDDSIVRVIAGSPRVLRRARGFAPAPLLLPPGFEAAGNVLSFGGELKNTFCMLGEGAALLSPHLGDLQDPMTRADYKKALKDFREFFEFEPRTLACDMHPDYFSTHVAQAESSEGAFPLIACQHHHAHIAACMAENGLSRDAPAVIGVALDGMGYGDDGTLWGGEFLLADYARYQRLGTFKPVALLGGEAAIREPWRNTYAHIQSQMGWASFAMQCAELDLYRFLERRPRALLDGMLKGSVNSPLTSSCGRLFDAVAAAIGFARERAWYEGQGAMELEAAVDEQCLMREEEKMSYPFSISRTAGLACIEPLAMWRALFRDLKLRTPVGIMAARFHLGLARVIEHMVEALALQIPGTAPPVVALSGGVFQNRILFELVFTGLQARGYRVLTHRLVPCNDGGLAFGQALIAAARVFKTSS